MTAAHVEDVVWRRAAALRALRAEMPSDVEDRRPAFDAAIAEADQALVELGSLAMRRALKDDWAPSMRRVRAEKDELLRLEFPRFGGQGLVRS
jgi:hypothetical protein